MNKSSPQHRLSPVKSPGMDILLCQRPSERLSKCRERRRPGGTWGGQGTPWWVKTEELAEAPRSQQGPIVRIESITRVGILGSSRRQCPVGEHCWSPRRAFIRSTSLWSSSSLGHAHPSGPPSPTSCGLSFSPLSWHV